MDWRAPSRGILQHRLDALGQRRAGQDRVYRDARAGGPLGDAARDGRDWLRIVRHGRYVVFQLAEVAVPRVLFAKILRRIDGLRLRSPPFPA
jgi:hypothetical protein